MRKSSQQLLSVLILISLVLAWSSTAQARSLHSRHSRSQIQNDLTGGLEMGINVGSAPLWELQFASTLGAHNARIGFPIGTPTSVIDPVVEAYGQQGIHVQLLATFTGQIPTSSQISNLALWAQRYGPGGTLWSQTGLNPGLAVTQIEFGNESGDSYQYPSLANRANWYATSTYAHLAQAYGIAYVSAVKAINSANPQVRLLAVADSSGDVPQWLSNMFKSTPNFGSHVEGWTLHPYGSQWRTDVNKTLAQTQTLGASSSVPVYVTEMGVASDGGACLTQDYGLNPCMNYSQAASTLQNQVSALEQDLGSRLEEIDLYGDRDLSSQGATNNAEDYFGALQSDGQPKGQFTTTVESILSPATS